VGIVRRGSRAFLLVGLVLGLVAGAAGSQPNREVDLVEVRGVIDPPTADYLRAQVRSAEERDAHALIVQLDTPGGLDSSMRDIIRDVAASPVPVVVWVAPRGARAASAGTFIAMAAHLVFMAEATEIGAASPVNLGGGSDAILDKKVTNDAAAFIEELARTRGRNAEWARSAVTEAAAIGATEAEEIGVIDGKASSLRALLEALDGRTVALADAEAELDTWDPAQPGPNVAVNFKDMGPLQQLLHIVTDPEIAFLLLLIGFFGLIFELYNPGIGLAGILGGIALILAFYSLSVLPTNWAGVLLIALAVIFFLVDLHVAGLGVFTVGGLVALVAGGLILFSGAPDALRLSWWSIALGVAVSLLFFISVMTAALRVRLRRPITGEEGIVGEVGEAQTDIAPEGTVMTKGTLWRARTMETGIAAGSKVKIMASEGLVLLVEPLHEKEDRPA
jgi:membrane-bound serine protease (ClpP class)